MTPSATSAALTSLESQKPGLLWRTAPMDDGQARLMGMFASEQAGDYVVFYEDTSYGEGLFGQMQTTLGSTDQGQCTGCGFSFEAGSASIASLTRALDSDKAITRLEKADSVFFFGAQQEHIKEMVRRLANGYFGTKTLFFSDAAASAELVEDVPLAAMGQVRGTRASPPAESEALRFFVSPFEATFDQSPLIHSFTANAYDAAWLMIAATLRPAVLGEEISAESIAQSLRLVSDKDWADLEPPECPISDDDGVCLPLTLDASNLDAILEAWRTRGKLDVRGASGALNYCPEDEELERSIDAFELWHLEPAAAGTMAGSPSYEIVPEELEYDAPSLSPCGQ